MLKVNDTGHFDLLLYFEGRTIADGVFEDRSGREKRRFVVEMNGTADGNRLILDESFLFGDGERQHRVWTLTRGTGLDFSGTCEDAVSTAHGRFDQEKAFLTSELRLTVGTRQIAMRFDDVFYRTGENTVLNRSTVSKWGIRLGQVLILFRKPQRSA